MTPSSLQPSESAPPVTQVSSVFRFISDGREFICAWHPGWDAQDPANLDASHGCCDACYVKWMRREGAAER